MAHIGYFDYYDYRPRVWGVVHVKKSYMGYFDYYKLEPRVICSEDIFKEEVQKDERIEKTDEA